MLSARPLSVAPANALNTNTAFGGANGTAMHQAASLKANVLGAKAGASAAVNCYAAATTTTSTTVVTPAMKGFPVKVIVQDQPVKPAAITRPVISTAPQQPQVCRQQLLDELAILRTEFERMRAFSASSPECQEDGKGQERVAHLDFVLKYIAQVVQSVEHAGPDQLPQLDLQIKTSLLPLKESLLATSTASSSSSSSSTTTSPSTTMPSSPASSSTSLCDVDRLAPAQPADDAWMSECSTSAASDSSGEVEGLDDLDFECFSLVMDDDATAKPPTNTIASRPAIRCGPLAEIDQDDTFTDTASLSSEEPASPRAISDLKRPFDSISTDEPRTEEDLLAKRRSVSVSSIDPSKARPQGPRTVDYQCGQCSEVYKATTALNPWVALEQQECPKCKKMQIPRIDITLPANVMDYHPALLAEEGDDDSDDEAEDLAAREAEEELDDFEEEDSMTASQAARLVVLMGHARTCPGLHKSPAHAEVCRNVKYLMLHIRDCDGKTLDGEPCAYPWCKAGKLLLGHLVRCYEPEKCGCCSMRDLPKSIDYLRCLAPGAIKQQQQMDSDVSRASDLVFGPL